MAKGLVVALMLAVAFIGAFFAVRTLFKRNEAVVYNKNYTWHEEFDAAAGMDTLVRGRKINDIKNDVNKLIIALNKAMDDAEIVRSQGENVKSEFPKIVLQKIEQQTATVEVVNGQYLTRKMGSSGAQDYLAATTYTLTENPGIKSINFVFNAGDHAMPGLYSRESFTAYKLVVDDGRKH
jgi:hypothetical protein